MGNAMALQVGDRVTVRERVEAYYSRYAGQPEQWLEPGVVAVVVRPHVPTVRGPRRSFILVEFEGGPMVSNPPTSTWRAALHPENVVRV